MDSTPGCSRVDTAKGELSTQQQVALGRLIAGFAVDEAALAANVSERTVRRWLDADSLFKSELEMARRNGFEMARLQLSLIAETAMELVASAVSEGNLAVSLAIGGAKNLLERLEQSDPEDDPLELSMEGLP